MMAGMRTIGRPALVLLALVAWLLAAAVPVAACTGGSAPLSIGIRGATSIYYARIVAATRDGNGFHDVRLDVGRVIRGPAPSHVTRVVAAEVCEGFTVGDNGIVVLGSVDPFGVGPDDTYNFFYVLGPGRTSAAEAAALFAGLPDTGTASGSSQLPAPGTPPWLALAFGTAVVVLVHADRRSPGRREREKRRSRSSVG